MSKTLRPFHLAFPIHDINQTIDWYKNILGCTIGRQDTRWVDFNFLVIKYQGILLIKI